MIIYLRVCLIIGFLVAMLGFVCPYLTSYNDDFVSTCGFVLLLIIPVFLWWQGTKLIHQIQFLIKEKNNV